MNSFNGIGRPTADAEFRVSQDGNTKIARYTLAIDRIGEGADFIRCIAFNKGAEFAEKYVKKGVKIGVSGHIQTGSYKDKDGKTVYTTDVIVNQHYFCEKAEATPAPVTDSDDFMTIPDGIAEELPFV